MKKKRLFRVRVEFFCFLELQVDNIFVVSVHQGSVEKKVRKHYSEKQNVDLDVVQIMEELKMDVYM